MRPSLRPRSTGRTRAWSHAGVGARPWAGGVGARGGGTVFGARALDRRGPVAQRVGDLVLVPRRGGEQLLDALPHLLVGRGSKRPWPCVEHIEGVGGWEPVEILPR